MLQLIVIVSSLVMGCSGDDDRFETLSKLRGLGVGFDQVMMKATDVEQTVTATIHAVTPEKTEIEIDVFDDSEDAFFEEVQSLELVNDTAAYQDFSKIRYFTINATFKVPSKSRIRFIDGAKQYRYGFRLRSGAEEEIMIGKFPVVHPDSDDGKKNWIAPTLSIASPGTKKKLAKGSEIDIVLTSKVVHGEDSKLGWFTSEGKIENRRSASTKWETGGESKQVLIATLRTKRSRAFAIKVQEFNFE